VPGTKLALEPKRVISYVLAMMVSRGTVLWRNGMADAESESRWLELQDPFASASDF